MSKENMTQHDIDLIAAQRKGHDTGYLQGFQMGCRHASRELQALKAKLERMTMERDEAVMGLASACAMVDELEEQDLERETARTDLERAALKLDLDRVMAERDEAESELTLHKQDRLRLRAEDLRLRREVERLTKALEDKP